MSRASKSGASIASPILLAKTLYQYEATINNANVLNHIIPLRNLKWIKQYSSIVSEVDSLETKRHMQKFKRRHQFIDVQQYKMH
jgi:hypothetical protein